MNKYNEFERKEKATLSEMILSEHPELISLSNDDIIHSLNNIYYGLKAVNSYLRDVNETKPTGNIRYHLSMVQQTIEVLKGSNNVLLNEFIVDYQVRIANTIRKAAQVIGDKRRDHQGIYR